MAGTEEAPTTRREKRPPRDGDELRRVWGANVARARKRKGWTQVMLAEKSGVHQTTIAKYESGDTKPSEQHKIDVARALGRNPSTLFPLVLPTE